MSKKFTEEQYQQIVEAWDNDGDYNDALSLVIEVVDDFEDGYSYNEALTLANPKSREWAHEHFVEKEKKYVWTSKKHVTRNGNGFEIHKRLYRTLNGDISDVLKGKDDDIYEEEYLTETEIREWGYNPEMFDK